MMYQAEIEVAKHPSKRIHHERQSYNKTPKWRYFRILRPLWRCVRRVLPKPKPHPQGGRPPADKRAVLNGIWYELWSGCQWKAIHRDWLGVCSSTLHQRFQEWQQAGVFLKVMILMARFYARRQPIGWLFQAIDSKACPAPLGGQETGKSPVDRGKRGRKIHLLVDQRGAPLSVHITAANRHDKWMADDLIVSIVVARPDPEAVEQHIGMDKGYDYPDVHQFVEWARYIASIKHRRKRGEPLMDACPLPGETQFPARRWVVERTLAWLAKRRSIRVRWCKKADNWLGFIQLSCAHILMDMTVYG